MANTTVAAVEGATTKLIAAYREERARLDGGGVGAIKRAAGVAYMVDSSSAAHAALVSRHDAPEAAATLGQLRDALAREDSVKKLMLWRKPLISLIGAITGITFVAVCGFGIHVISLGIDKGKGIAAAGGGVMLLFAGGNALKAGYEAFHESKSLGETERSLRPVEDQFFASIGGSRASVDRVDMMRLGGALLQALVGFVFSLVILALFFGWVSSFTPKPSEHPYYTVPEYQYTLPPPP